MTTQSQFFSNQQTLGNDQAADSPKSRLFYYDGQLFEDPGPDYTPQDILNFLSATYPELRNGSWTNRTNPDGVQEITFHKVTGEKGADNETSDPAQWNWSNRTILGMGGYAVVYGIDDTALKVGHIEPNEVEAQRHFAALGLALPILDYHPEINLPKAIGREICPIHGIRQEILPHDHQLCSCEEAQSALLMPIVDCDLADVDPGDVQTFIAGFARDCEIQLGRYWDTRPANVARYHGNLIALDFGQTS